MKNATRFIYVVLCVLSLSMVGVPAASADNGPHVKEQGLTPDSCAACHRAHTAQAPYLLKQSEESLCYSCHGSSGSGSDLDVADGIGYAGADTGGAGREGGQFALRGGGFKNAAINTGVVEKTLGPEGAHGKPLYRAVIPVLEKEGHIELAATTSSHSTNSSKQIAWGNGPISATVSYGKEVELRCGSCHDQHGNGMYRILRPIPEESGASESEKVEIPDEPVKEYGTTNYWDSWEVNNKEFRYKINQWCSLCHTRLLATGSSATESSGDAVYTYRHASNWTRAQYEKIEKESEEHASEHWEKTEPSCIQCHVAHGTDATMGENSSKVSLPNGEQPTLDENGGTGGGDSYLLRLNNRGVCQTCHNV